MHTPTRVRICAHTQHEEGEGERDEGENGVDLEEGKGHSKHDLGAFTQEAVPDASGGLCGQGAGEQAGEPAGCQVFQVQLRLCQGILQPGRALEEQILQHTLFYTASILLPQSK